MTTMIKASSVCINNPTRPLSLFYRRSPRLSFINVVSFQIPSGIDHRVGPLRLSRAVFPILNSHKQYATTPVTFQCRCAKENFLAHFKTGSYSRLWNRARNLLTPWFIYTCYFWFLWMLPKWVFVVYSLAFLKVIPLGESSKQMEPKQMEPENILLEDLVGVEDAKVQFQEFLHSIHKSKNTEMILDVVLLYGPQGTGKNTLVHALAREAKVPFFPVSAREIAGGEAGRKEIKSLFIEARASSPSIVYIQDIDDISRHRGNGEYVETIHELCDEIKKCLDVMVIATTDRPETLDPTLMGWFFEKVHVGRPNEDSRRKFIGLKLNKFLKEEDREAICNLVASQTPGFVWDNLIKIARTSFRLAEMRGDDYVSMDVVIQALEKVKPLIVDDKFEPTVQDPMQHTEFGYQN